MTKKRFTHNEDDWEILDRNKHFAYAHSAYQAEKIIQELNELVETNRELYQKNELLKKSVKRQQDSNNECAKLIEEQQKENEQLEQFKKKVFSLFDKEIARNEEAIEWGKETGADYGAIGFYNHMLYRLKKELKE